MHFCVLHWVPKSILRSTNVLVQAFSEEKDLFYSDSLVTARHFYMLEGPFVKKELRGETLRIDTGCIVAFSPGIDYDIQRAGNLKSMFFGGEGLFLATLRGHGTVYLQSLPFSRLADRIIQHAPSAGGSQKGEGICARRIGQAARWRLAFENTCQSINPIFLIQKICYAS